MMEKLCVVIPTYNNEGTLLQVINDVKRYVPDVLVVNDGCTDRTSQLLADRTDIEVISYEKNKGKGYALKKGFEEARSRGYTHVLTMDSDGQHFASDIPAFLEAHGCRPDALLVGSRNLEAENMPGGNTFANKFSNFWFRIQTLQNLPDTQTGYRLYPLRHFRRLWWLTNRYEAELELLVSAAWKGVELHPIPIQVYYPPMGERITHFRPRRDFLRITLLNTVLCILAIVYGGPRMLWNKLRR